MKALSIRQPHITLISEGIKTIETRTWSTNYRGDLLLCASSNFDKKHVQAIRELFIKENGFAPVTIDFTGVAVCIAEIYDCKKMVAADEDAACCDLFDGYSWFLRNIRQVKPFAVKGKLSLFEVDIIS
jgi:hypothetical protein